MSGEGEPTVPEKGGVGICVSGGGLRAASFGLGALQALQDKRGLLRGPHAARYLSAVSGGSYIAGAYALVNNSGRIEADGGSGTDPGLGSQSPFAPGTPEAEHLRRHCRYMVEDGGALLTIKLGFRVILNLLMVVGLVALVGLWIGEVAGWSAERVLPSTLDSPDGVVWLQTVLAVAGVLAARHAFQQVGRNRLGGPWSAARLSVAAEVAFFFATAASLAVRLEAVPVLRSPAWILEHAVAIAAGLGALCALIGVVALLGRRFPHAAFLQRLTRYGVGLLTLRLVQAIGLLIISWMIVAFFDQFLAIEGLSLPLALTAILLPIVVPVATPYIADRISPHYVYRDLLDRCFSVIRRGGEAVRPRDPRDVELSGLWNPVAPYPELLICAAVNVSDIGATPAGSNVLSCVFDSSRMTIPALGVSLPMDQLERLQRPTGFPSGWGKAVNLASAIAMTGAAVSPAMGRRTRNDLRALFAALNIRLGVWLPNPINPDVRGTIATRSEKVELGTTQIVRELFGFHSETWEEIYVTDGGHYDNLGLVELLRKECEEIWCIDASGDKPGRATALAEALLTASGELGVHVDLDLDAFARTPDCSLWAPVLKSAHVRGTVHYANGTEAKLHVVKLGITERTPSALHEYRRTDRRFPHHSTLNQIYRAERFDAYRDLGWASTQEALALA